MWVEGMAICISWMAALVPNRDLKLCVCCVCVELLFFVWMCLFILGDDLLCRKVVSRCGIENGVFTRYDGFFGRSDEVGVLGCWVGFVCFN